MIISTADLLQDLVDQKETLAININSTGIKANTQETLNTLVPKVPQVYNKGREDGYNEGYLEGCVDGRDNFIFSVTNNGEDFSYFFYNNKNIIEAPTMPFDTSINMKCMFSGCESLVNVDNINTENTQDMSYMFSGCTALLSIQNVSLKNALYTNYMFNKCSNITEADFDFSNVLTANYMFQLCTSLLRLGDINLTNCTNATGLLYSCRSLSSVGNVIIGDNTVVTYLFYGCRNLSTIQSIQIGNCTSLSNLYLGSTKVSTLPFFDTSHVTVFSSAFRSEAGEYNSISKIPLYDTSNGVDFCYMLYGMRGMTECPAFDFSKATCISNLFQECTKMTRIGNFCTPLVESIRETFVGCEKLTTIERLDWSGATTISGNCFYRCYMLTTIGFEGTINAALNLSYCSRLSYETLIKLLNVLADRTAEDTVLTLKLGTTNLNKLTDEEKAIATAKGWTLA